MENLVLLTGVISVLVTVYTVATSAKKGAFEDLQKVVENLRKSLEYEQKQRIALDEALQYERKQRMALEAAFNRERNQRVKIENWARRLVKQLQSAKIIPEEMEE